MDLLPASALVNQGSIVLMFTNRLISNPTQSGRIPCWDTASHFFDRSARLWHTQSLLPDDRFNEIYDLLNQRVAAAANAAYNANLAKAKPVSSVKRPVQGTT